MSAVPRYSLFSTTHIKEHVGELCDILKQNSAVKFKSNASKVQPTQSKRERAENTFKK